MAASQTSDLMALAWTICLTVPPKLRTCRGFLLTVKISIYTASITNLGNNATKIWEAQISAQISGECGVREEQQEERISRHNLGAFQTLNPTPAPSCFVFGQYPWYRDILSISRGRLSTIPTGGLRTVGEEVEQEIPGAAYQSSFSAREVGESAGERGAREHCQ
ncbi:hypothetical protein P7K49_007501 [Saguinus oedipus]|uniref:Uncharacterized protein n=1 Tax=Saguinus oedipus TaxID=9490 RepID=A0ABQ9VVR7_SAGOE|nr:hypothetical protein P7K49_007501 [Saguinus oedipus]